MHAYYGSPAHPSSHSSPLPVPQRAYSPIGSPPYPGSSPIPDTHVQGRYVKPEPDLSPAPGRPFTGYACYLPATAGNAHSARRLSDAPEVKRHTSSPSSPMPRQLARRRLSPSPSPSSRPRHQLSDRRTVMRSPPKRDAYEALNSPEANWSTIPAKKTRVTGSGTNKENRGMATASSFRLPITVGPTLSAQRDADAMAQSSSRRMTYLPPPPKSRPVNRSGRNNSEGSSSCSTHDRAAGAVAASLTIPSPPSFRPLAVKRVAPQMLLSSFKCPTPSRRIPRPHPYHASRVHAERRSPSPDGSYPSSDTVVAFDTPSLARRYRDVRHGVAEVRIYPLVSLPYSLE